jgi:hypothetical protein
MGLVAAGGEGRVPQVAEPGRDCGESRPPAKGRQGHLQAGVQWGEDGERQRRELERGVDLGGGGRVDLERSRPRVHYGSAGRRVPGDVKVRTDGEGGVFREPKGNERGGESAVVAERHGQHVDDDLVGERIQVRAQDGRHVVLLGQVPVQHIAGPSNQAPDEGHFVLLGDDQVGKERGRRDPAERDEIGRGGELLGPVIVDRVRIVLIVIQGAVASIADGRPLGAFTLPLPRFRAVIKDRPMQPGIAILMRDSTSRATTKPTSCRWKDTIDVAVAAKQIGEGNGRRTRVLTQRVSHYA